MEKLFNLTVSFIISAIACFIVGVIAYSFVDLNSVIVIYALSVIALTSFLYRKEKIRNIADVLFSVIFPWF